MRKYNYRQGRRFCGNCSKWWTKEQFSNSEPFCPSCGTRRKLRVRPRGEQGSHGAGLLSGPYGPSLLIMKKNKNK